MTTLPTPYYDDGNGITIYHSKCEPILSVISPDSVDLLLADPPYGVSAVQSNGRAKGKDVRPGHVPGTWKGWEKIAGDDAPFDPTHLLEFPRVVLFGANHYADKLPPSRSWLVWDKCNGTTPDDNADAELIWTNIPGVIRMYRQCWRGFTRENDSLEPHKHIHPTQKPVNLMIWLVEKFTKPGDLVVDPYMGSGPIARACQLLGRRYIGIELEEVYCRATVQRLQQSVMQFDEPATRANRLTEVA